MASTEGTILSIAITCAVAVGSAFAGEWMWFGFACWLILALELKLGFGRAASSPLVRTAVAALFCSLSGLLAAMRWVHDPSGGPRTFWGFPAGTALLIYGIWPLAIALTLFVTAVFDRLALPPEHVARLLAQHGRKEST